MAHKYKHLRLILPGSSYCLTPVQHKYFRILPDFKGTLILDFWKPYNTYFCNHALCNVHHLRELTFCVEVLSCTWAGKMKQFLLKHLQKVNSIKADGPDASLKDNYNTCTKSMMSE